MELSPFAEATMLYIIAYITGFLTCAFAYWIALLQSDKSQSNPQEKPQLCQKGESLLRDHAELDTISPRPNPAAEFEPMQGFREIAKEYKPALDVLTRKKSKPSQIGRK